MGDDFLSFYVVPWILNGEFSSDKDDDDNDYGDNDDVDDTTEQDEDKRKVESYKDDHYKKDHSNFFLNIYLSTLNYKPSCFLKGIMCCV